MKRIRFLRQKEVDIKLRHEAAERPRKLIPWWARALRRVGIRPGLRQQTTGSLSGARSARVRVPEPPTYTRRSVVKASFSRNAKKGAWTAHAKYLSRPGAQQEIAKGFGFDSTREGIDMIATVKGWEKNDELMWRFIVSPEDANRLNLRDHVRELVGQMERDLGTKLDWVAIDHHNTDDAHAHLLIRGVRENGRTLKIDREYLRSGIRMRSQEIATRELGPRPEREMLHARERVVRRDQWTEIDRAIQRKADANRVVSYEHFQPRSDGARVRAEQEINRLQFLSGLGLAQRIDERSWQLSENHERELRDRQQSNDVIKTRSRDRQRQTSADRGLER
ncbi:MAG: relaxase/mobilization nuclease domain-containing protein [Candidatus Binataceae bacterium]|nr:relaxase/mobilization nuclease domain-containing protein [Candidatus Binataceae bacterium]